MADRAIAADVEYLAVARIVRARAQKGIGRIVDEHEIAELCAVSVNLKGAAFDRQPDEPPDEALAIVADQLTRSVHIRQAERAGADAEDVVVYKMVVLAGRF